jgi:hypothetical protein
MLVIAWLLGLAWVSLVVAVRASNIQMKMMDPPMLCLLVPVWLLCFGLVVVGTFRITSLIRNRVLRVIAMLAVVALQCYLYCGTILAVAICVYFWAGGQC